MKYVKLFIASLTLFGMLTACGDGFQSINSSKDHDKVVDDGKNSVEPGETTPEEDDRIFSMFEIEVGGLDDAMIEHLALSIKAFELELTVTEHPGGASQNVSASATMMLGCDSNQHYQFSRSSINAATLASGDAVSLGSSGLYEMILYCTITNCDEAVVAVRRQGDDTTDALVLIGLKVRDAQNTSRTQTRRYETRLVDASNEVYTTALKPDFYLNNACSADEFGDIDAFGGSGDNDPVSPINGVSDDFDDDFSTYDEAPWFMDGGSL